MAGKRTNKANKCKECGKIIRKENKSGLCSHHYKMDYMKKLIKERKAKELCIQCGKKVEPIIKIPIRCKQCREKQDEAYSNKVQDNKKLNLSLL